MSAVLQPAMEQTADLSEQALVEQWLTRFNEALVAEPNTDSAASIAALFATESHWRDLLAFTWTITPTQGPKNIAALMVAKQKTTKARAFAITSISSIASSRTAPRRVTRAGFDVIEALLQFETHVGRGCAVLRLQADDPSKAFQLMTSLQALKGCEEQVGKHRPKGQAYSRNFGGTNWKDQRTASQAYNDREPTVLIAGGGQAGLSLAATLVRLGVDTLVVDRLPRPGDCWRTRYHSLALHNSTEINHLPYLPFPSTWPMYLSKDMLADWFETYAWALEINFWPGHELVSGAYDEASGTWSATVRRADGSERTLHPKHLVFANGLVGFPHIPDLPGLKDFKGDVMHTAQFTNGTNWRGKKALVLGTGTSAHDVAQDLHGNGVDATIIQRGATTVVSIDPSAKLIYGLYEGLTLDEGDLLASTNTFPVVRRNLQLLMSRMVGLDRKLIDDLIAAGFKWNMGDDNGGHQMNIRTRYGGYYLNAGCSELIINGEVSLMQYDQIEKFVAGGALLKDGAMKPADLIVLGTGYVTQEVLVKKLLGEAVAKKIGPVWGIAPDGEMNNMWRRTAQEGLWFVGGSFANCRIYSRYVALAIKAMEQGLLAKTAKS